jgi:hypothetical protein
MANLGFSPGLYRCMMSLESCGPLDESAPTCRAEVVRFVEKEQLPVLISLSVKEKNCG